MTLNDLYLPEEKVLQNTVMYMKHMWFIMN